MILRTDITYTNYTKRRKLVAKRGLIVCSMEKSPFGAFIEKTKLRATEGVANANGQLGTVGILQ
jgi:hypothetical protein